MLCTALALCSTMQVQKFWPMPTRSQHPIRTNTLLKRKKQMLKWQKAKGYLEQAVALNAADANSKKILDAINAAAK